MRFKGVLRDYFTHFFYFYSFLSYRIFLTLVLSVFVGLLDGFGLAMFLPLLEMVDGKAQASSEAMGNLGFLVDWLKVLGFSLDLKTVLSVILVFFVLKGFAKFLEIYYRVNVQQYFIKRLRIDNIDKLSNFQYQAFVNTDVGRIQNTLSGETERVAGAYRAYFMALQMGSMLAVYIVLAFLANPQFAFLVTVGGIASSFLFKLVYSNTKHLSRKITTANHSYQGLLIQKVAFFKYLKATSMNRKFSEKLKTAVREIENNNLKIGKLGAIIQAIREPIIIAVVVIVILIQVNYFDQSLGLILLSLIFFYRSLTFLMAIQTAWNGFLNVSGSLENVTTFQKLLSRHQDRTGNLVMSGFKREIVVNDLDFSYGNRLILDSVKLSVRKNQTYAFVGESGSGKSTLVNLISGILLPSRGNITIDGIDYSNLNIALLQSRIGYIAQEPVIFNDTIFNNVTFWAQKNSKNINRFLEVLERSAILDFVMDLEDKEDTFLGNSGINLSGGQKQRLSIARELFKEIDLLILDEATSSLDPETENTIKNNIEYLKGKLTIIIVAHRLSSIRHADKIILLDKGKIVSIGSYDELIEDSELFKRSVILQ